MRKVRPFQQDKLESMAVLEGLDFVQKTVIFQHCASQCLDHVKGLPKRLQPKAFSVFLDFHESNYTVITALFQHFAGETQDEAMEQMVKRFSFEDKATAFHLTGQENLQEILAYKGADKGLLQVESNARVFFEHYSGGIDSLYNLMVEAQKKALAEEDL